MAMHVLYVGDPGPYLIGEDGSELLRIFRPTADGKGDLSQQLAMGSITAHMPQTDFLDYEGTPEEEAAILEKAQAALAARGKPPEDTGQNATA